MSRICEVTGTRPITGHKISHSNVKTNRWFYPNLQVKKYFVPELNRWVSLKLTTRAMRTIDKKGIYVYLKEQEKKGFKVL